MTPGSEDEEAEEQPQAMRYRHLHAHENDALGSEMRAELKAGNRGFKSWSNRTANCICWYDSVQRASSNVHYGFPQNDSLLI